MTLCTGFKMILKKPNVTHVNKFELILHFVVY